MDLNTNQQARLEKIFEVWRENPEKLNDWLNEKFLPGNQDQFITDKNYAGEDGYFVSPKMWKIFTEIEAKLGIEHEDQDQQDSFRPDPEEESGEERDYEQPF